MGFRAKGMAYAFLNLNQGGGPVPVSKSGPEVIKLFHAQLI